MLFVIAKIQSLPYKYPFTNIIKNNSLKAAVHEILLSRSFYVLNLHMSSVQLKKKQVNKITKGTFVVLLDVFDRFYLVQLKK